jgi:hypothetical protein
MHFAFGYRCAGRENLIADTESRADKKSRAKRVKESNEAGSLEILHAMMNRIRGDDQEW